jgi:molybdopterin molybdotransferase
VGAADYTRQIMQTLGDVRFWTVAMRPGRPVAFGRVGNAYYFGLPGNPVAVMITFYFFARQALQQLMGQAVEPLPMLRAAAGAPIRKRPGRTEYQRGILDVAPDGGARVSLTGSQGSGVLRSMSEANCIVVLHHDQGPVETGDPVDCLPFHGLI